MPVPVAPTAAVAGQPSRAGVQFNNLAAQVAYVIGGGTGLAPVVRVRQAIAQAIPNGTETKITFDTVDEDTDAGWTVANNNYTIVTAGMWLFSATGAFAANSTGTRMLHLQGGVPESYVWVSAASDGNGRGSAQVLVRMAAGVAIQASLYQTSGAALNSGPSSAVIALTGTWLSK